MFTVRVRVLAIPLHLRGLISDGRPNLFDGTHDWPATWTGDAGEYTAVVTMPMDPGTLRKGQQVALRVGTIIVAVGVIEGAG